METDNTAKITYVGPEGAGLGFKLAGMEVLPSANSSELLNHLNSLYKSAKKSIIFVDEGQAAEVMEEIEKLSTEAMPAIVLLANPLNPKNLAASRMKGLMVKAVGSDIFGS